MGSDLSRVHHMAEGGAGHSPLYAHGTRLELGTRRAGEDKGNKRGGSPSDKTGGEARDSDTESNDAVQVGQRHSADVPYSA